MVSIILYKTYFPFGRNAKEFLESVRNGYNKIKAEQEIVKVDSGDEDDGKGNRYHRITYHLTDSTVVVSENPNHPIIVVGKEENITRAKSKLEEMTHTKIKIMHS